MIFLAITVWGHAGVLLEVLAEERGVGKVQGCGNLLDAVCGVAQAALYLLHSHHFDYICGGAARFREIQPTVHDADHPQQEGIDE